MRSRNLLLAQSASETQTARYITQLPDSSL
jgi:hypothetical protein